MQYSFLKELVTSAWQIDAITAQVYAPVLRGVFNGLHFEREDPDEKYKPFQVAATASKTGATASGKTVNVQPVRGVMLKNDSGSGIIGTRTMASNLLAADKQAKVCGHILLIESGGGQVAAVPELSDAIKKLSKPIVAFVDGCMCSAAMYVGSYCKQIIASHDTDSVGCIGTMIELSGFPKFNKEPSGYTYARIYADQASEKNDDYETALTGDFKLIKERILNPHNEQFIADIRANRPNVKDEHLKGRTFRASEVVGTLIDSIGTFETAVQSVVELSNSTTQQFNNSTMKSKLTALMALLAVTELVIEDGQTSLNEQQLEAIENALAAGNTAATDLATANANLQTANATIAKRDATIAEQATKITDLEAAAGAPPATVVKPTDGNGNNQEPENTYQNVKNILKGA
jgi:protease-4